MSTAKRAYPYPEILRMAPLFPRQGQRQQLKGGKCEVKRKRKDKIAEVKQETRAFGVIAADIGVTM